MMLFASAVAVVAIAGPAFAQTSPPADSQAVTGARPGNEIGTGNSLPTSSNASNINRTDTRADIAPSLPIPPIGENANPSQYLAAAQNALRRNRTGEAQEALERAETRLLDRSTAPDSAGMPDQGPMIQQISDARMALAKGDKAGAMKVIQDAMAGGAGTSSTVGASSSAAASSATGAPMRGSETHGATTE
jgi:hypothetical protein